MAVQKESKRSYTWELDPRGLRRSPSMRLAPAVLPGFCAQPQAAMLFEQDFEGTNPWSGIAGHFTIGADADAEWFVQYP